MSFLPSQWSSIAWAYRSNEEVVRRFGVRRDGIVPSACARLVLRFASSPSSYNIIALSKAYRPRTPKRAGVRRWLAIGRRRAGRVGGIERVGDQHRGPAKPALNRSAADPPRGRDRAQEQPLPRAVEL